MLMGQDPTYTRMQRMAAHDKEISIRQIVEDERDIIENRFKKDLRTLKDQNQKELTQIAA